ncbi:MAG: hypothetical protein ACFCVE_09300 [Phycisphaerae bacterium]
MDAQLRKKLTPGTRVKVFQQIAARHYSMGTPVVGTIVKYEQKQTGSWYAHSRDGKLWLDRLTIRKDSGEVSVLNLDDYTNLDVIGSDEDEHAPAPNA